MGVREHLLHGAVTFRSARLRFDTKFAAERLVLGDTRLEGVAVNPGITMGHSDTNHNGGRILLQVHQGGPFGVPTGATTVASLDDVVQGHLAALDRGISGERYVLGGHTPTWVELFQAAAQVVGAPPPTRVLPKWLIKIAGEYIYIYIYIYIYTHRFTHAHKNIYIYVHTYMHT